MGEAAAERGDIQGRGDQGGASIVELLGQMRRETGRVIVEEARHIGLGHGTQRLAPSEERQARRRALCVGRIRFDRRAECFGRALFVAKLLARFAERKTRRRPAWRLLERLLEHLRRDRVIAVLRSGFAVCIAPIGDEMAAEKGVARF